MTSRAQLGYGQLPAPILERNICAYVLLPLLSPRYTRNIVLNSKLTYPMLSLNSQLELSTA